MRINRSLLIKIAQDTVATRASNDRNILAAYLIGSVLDQEDPLIGKTTDIDLVFIHIEAPPVEREIQRLNEQIHLDIVHHDQAIYQKARQLRQHPWLGPAVFRCQTLHDPQHFMDFTQASVRSQFDHAENVLERSKSRLDQARQLWMDLSFHTGETSPESITQYLAAVEHSANAIASLSGAPLAERRLLLEFPARAENSGQPSLHIGLLGLLGAIELDKETIQGWMSVWSAAFNAASGAADPPPQLHPERYSYYQQAVAAYLEGPQFTAALWPLLLTWSDAIVTLQKEKAPFAETHRQHWEKACQRLGLSGDDFEERLAALDAYLDTAEEVLENWGQ